jgi:hypothetical protein
MNHIFLQNGITQLVLKADTEVERMLLDALLSQGPLEITYIRQPVGVLGVSVKDGIVIRKLKTDDTSKTENVCRVQPDETHLEESGEGEVL